MSRRARGAALFALAGVAFGAAAVTSGCGALLGIPDEVTRADAAPSASTSTPVQDAQTPLETGVDAAILADASDAGTDANADGEAGPPPCDVTREFDTPVLIPSLSTPGHEGETRFPSDDELTVMYDAVRGDAGTTDIFTATRASLTSPFGTPVRLAGPVSTDDYEHAGNVTENGLMLFFEHRPRTGTVSKINSATRLNTGDPFGVPSPVDINTGDYTAMPFVRGDGKEIYHVSANGPGATKIFVATLVAGTGYVQTEVSEVNLVKPGGDPAFQFAPVLTPNSLTIYFATTNHLAVPARRDTDIWVATRARTTDKFSAPREVANVNTLQDEEPSWITADGCRLYLQSTRPGGPGGQDLYVASRKK